MTSSTSRGVRRGLMLLAAGSIAAGAPAQRPPSAQLPPGAVVQPLPEVDGAELRRQLTRLADNPRSFDALIGAGRAALELRDAEAALSFFARADEMSPRDARAKAGMASAMVQLGQARPALDLFAEATSLGAPEVEIAADRGLAFDMIGDPRRAQRDYGLVLARRDDEEVRRRLALSLAIGGDRDAALRAIDAQLRANDRAAWRVQAFVLALTGDAAGARRTAEGMMPPQAAAAMAPFLARLEALSPAQKAMAVHFGHFPANATALASAAPRRIVPDAAENAATGAAERRREPTSRRRPAAREPRDSSDRFGLRRERRAARRTGPAARPASPPPEPPRQEIAQVQPRWAPQPAPPPRPAEPPSSEPAEPRPTPGFSLEPSASPAAPAPEADGGLDDIAALVNALPVEAERPGSPPPPPPQPARAEPTRSETAQRPAARQAARPAHPARHWVQIAGGADRSALPREFARLRGLAPEELNGRAAYTTPLRATNRLLVGPFDSAREAQDFVNRLARREVAAFAWTSEAGQEIERLATSR